MRLYTRTGDAGTTQLGDGTRRTKADARVGAYGEVDHLTAVLMWCRARALAYVELGDAHDSLQEQSLLLMADRLQYVARRTFIMGTMVCHPTLPEDGGVSTHIIEEDVMQLEQWIDEYTSETPALTAFILPGSSELATRLHMARTTARSVERSLVSLRAVESLPSLALSFSNRLSDLLFAMARFADQLLGQEEIVVRESSSTKAPLMLAGSEVPESIGG